MAEIAGYAGHVDWGDILDSDIAGYRSSSWSLDLAGDTLDTTDFNSIGWRTFIAGLKSWTGSVELFVDATTRIQPSDVNSSATITVYLNSSNFLTGTAICNGWSPSLAVDGVETQSLSFTGTGALTNA